jgi:hypothetical protein
VTLTRALIGFLCSSGGLGIGVWLTAVCLLSLPAHLAGHAVWPLVTIGLIASLGGWQFPGSWWVIALLTGLPSLLFTSGWCYVIADEGQRNLIWPVLGVLAMVIAAVCTVLASWCREWSGRRTRRPPPT